MDFPTAALALRTMAVALMLAALSLRMFKIMDWETVLVSLALALAMLSAAAVFTGSLLAFTAWFAGHLLAVTAHHLMHRDGAWRRPRSTSKEI